MATLFGELQNEEKQKSHHKLSETLRSLLHCVYDCPSYIAKDLMKVLQDVNSEVGRFSQNAVEHVSLTRGVTVMYEEATMCSRGRMLFRLGGRITEERRIQDAKAHITNAHSL